MNNAVIDIFVVTYNRANYLKKSIKSILDQTYHKFNLIIIDNCSTDNTKQIVNEFHDSRIQYICHEKNIGGIGNINYAMTHAKSEYFMVFHDDDIMYETLVEDELNILENNKDISAISCKSDYIDKEDRKIGREKKWSGNLHKYAGRTLFNAYLNEQCFVLFPSIIYRTSFMRQNLIRLNAEVGPSADIYMCFDITQKGGVIAVYDKNLMAYRQHENQDSVQHRIDMIVLLFEALNKNSIYSKILLENRKGQKKYYRWLMHNEICMIQTAKTNCDNSLMAQSRYEKVLKFSRWDHFKYRIIIYDEKYFIISKTVYKLLKIIKQKG